MKPIYQDNILSGIDRARKRGFTIEFRHQDQKLIDRSTNASFTAQQCRLEGYERFEGLSDPADASILFLVRCGKDIKGYLSSAYGIYADDELLGFMQTISQPKNQ